MVCCRAREVWHLGLDAAGNAFIADEASDAELDSDDEHDFEGESHFCQEFLSKPLTESQDRWSCEDVLMCVYVSPIEQGIQFDQTSQDLDFVIGAPVILNAILLLHSQLAVVCRAFWSEIRAFALIHFDLVVPRHAE